VTIEAARETVHCDPSGFFVRISAFVFIVLDKAGRRIAAELLAANPPMTDNPRNICSFLEVPLPQGPWGDW